MHSRAYLLLQRDMERLQTEPVWGISASPVSDLNVFEWRARLCGPKGTDWEDGIFQLQMRFSSEYNTKPPDVVFMTIPFHPNIDMKTGKPCMDLLDEPSCWSENVQGVQYILLSIQALLAEPVLENAVNIHAAHCFVSSPRMYRQMVLDCVAASRRVAAGLPAHEEEEEERRRAAEQDELKKKEKQAEDSIPRQTTKRVTKVSFDDYHQLWRGLATTQPTVTTTSPLMQLLHKDAAFRNIHLGPSLQSFNDDINDKLQRFQDLKYGRVAVSNKKPHASKTQTNKSQQTQAQNPQTLREQRIQMMRQLYMSGGDDNPQVKSKQREPGMSHSHSQTPKETPISQTGRKSGNSIGIRVPSLPHERLIEDGDLDTEVDDLLTWTDKLTDTALIT
ncbi:ubiquitin-conjugating enzyme E2 U-like [Corticium candelabrum]|uniref:ubiquitin-conjugating enzyme E2 U-like n=1 Tax=Corticium candelabrum TaxID=121492 RepID=UPI002E274A73|nr:ubiquitin-conjugating enzyme E2 U-like [Corticium candelabrum]